MNHNMNVGIKNTETDDFVKKTDALQKAIAGLADGSVEVRGRL